MSIEHPRGASHQEEVPTEKERIEELPLPSLQALYRESEEQIARLETDLHKGIEHTIGVEDTTVRDISTEVGRKVARELDDWRTKKEVAGRILKDHGLPPDGYLAQ